MSRLAPVFLQGAIFKFLHDYEKPNALA